jgi:hypothetical protein
VGVRKLTIQRLKAMALLFSVAFLANAYAERAMAADKADSAQGVELTAVQAQNLGIVMAAAKAATFTPKIGGFGVVISVDAIAKSDSEVMAARAAAKQSAASLRRARDLATGAEAAVSQDALNIAERQSVSDNAALSLAEAQATATFGRNAPWMDEKKHDEIMQRFQSGAMALVRGTFPLTSLLRGTAPLERSPAKITISRIGPELSAASWTASEVWDAPADPEVPGRSVFALVNAPLASGERVAVSVADGTSRKGVLVPQAAIILADSIAWFYTREPNNNYVRHQVDLSLAMPGGYFVPAGAAPGTPIVVAGAGLLLARELGPSAESEE